jgi:hypothetical protein
MLFSLFKFYRTHNYFKTSIFSILFLAFGSGVFSDSTDIIGFMITKKNLKVVKKSINGNYDMKH